MAAVAIPKLSAIRDDTKLSALMANIKTCVNDLAASYRGNEVLTDMDTIPACSNVETSIDGDYVYKGTNISY